MSTKRKILLFVSLFLLAMAVLGYYVYNKGPENISKRKTLPVTAIELYETYIDDSLSAQNKFNGKVLLVTGVIGRIDKNQQGETILSLQTKEPNAYINCSMEHSPAGLQINDEIRIKGLCNGIGQGDADLGIKADVYLTRCQLEK